MDCTTVNRSFIIGDEWNYFNIYTGYKQSDCILTECLYPLSKYLLINELIDKWFFIRYSDPYLHLRVRFHSDEIYKTEKVIMCFSKAVKEYFISGQVWKIQSDTYNRELERYGTSIIELTEMLFYFDSEMIIKIISLPQVKENENLRWLLGLKMIDTFLTDFRYTLNDKIRLLNSLQSGFKQEFNITNIGKHQFRDNYRCYRNQIEEILETNSVKAEKFNELFRPIIEKSTLIQNTISAILEKLSGTVDVKLDNLLSSYIHMTINRLFRTQQRKHELVLYDYLFFYYTSINARIQKQEKLRQ